jgi:hypothetical protein
MFGCGGGGGSSSSSSSDGAEPTASGAISGTVTKGPVSGATVTAFAITNGAKGQLVGTATSDSQGAFMLSVADYSGPVMLQATGGTYVDEATGTSMSIAAPDVLSAVLTTMSAGSVITGIQVTPITSMAQSMALHMTGGMTDANIAAANTAVGNYFMVNDILHTMPMNPLAPGSGSTATQATMNYGMVLAAMSQYARTVGMTMSSTFVTAMTDDASDGVMDGKSAGTPISMGGGMMGGTMMQTEAGTAGLATAMTTFMSSSANKSGLTTTNVAPLMQQLMTTDGHMH